MPRATGRAATGAQAPHRLDELYDRLMETWGPEAEAWRAYEESGVYTNCRPDAESQARYDALYERREVVDSEKRAAWYAVFHAILEASGAEPPADYDLRSWGRAFAVVRTARRIYAIVPTSASNDVDLLGLAEVVAIDL